MYQPEIAGFQRDAFTRVRAAGKTLAEYGLKAVTGSVRFDKYREYALPEHAKDACKLIWAENVQHYAISPSQKRVSKEWLDDLVGSLYGFDEEEVFDVQQALPADHCTIYDVTKDEEDKHLLEHLPWAGEEEARSYGFHDLEEVRETLSNYGPYEDYARPVVRAGPSADKRRERPSSTRPKAGRTASGGKEAPTPPPARAPARLPTHPPRPQPPRSRHRAASARRRR